MNPTKVDRNVILKKLNLGKIKKDKENEKPKDIAMLNEKEFAHKQEQSNEIFEQLDSNLIALLPASSHSYMTSKSYIYKLNNVLNKRETENLVTSKLIHICIFNIIEQKYAPFILYLLNKDIKSNVLYFPHFYTSENVYTQAEYHIKNMFKEFNTPINLKGYIEGSYNVYMFYEAKKSHHLILESYTDIWWWVSMFEIINTNMILNFPIHNSVTEIFYTYPILMVLFNEKNNKIPSPYIGYFGGYHTYISFISAFGLPKQSPEGNLGPYYYFYTYKGAGRGAIWTQTRKEIIMNGEKITRDDYGVFKRGGLVRFAIFNHNIKYLLNREDDKEDDSQITQDLINNKDNEELSKFIKSTAKVRDVNGKWADHKDLVFIGSVLIKSDKFKDRNLDIQFAARDFNQQLPLTYHYIDTTKFSEVEGDIDKQTAPYNLFKYNIK